MFCVAMALSFPECHIYSMQLFSSLFLFLRIFYYINVQYPFTSWTLEFPVFCFLPITNKASINSCIEIFI